MTARVVDLFCGAGGLALGFRAAGCQIQGAVDFDELNEFFQRDVKDRPT